MICFCYFLKFTFLYLQIFCFLPFFFLVRGLTIEPAHVLCVSLFDVLCPHAP